MDTRSDELSMSDEDFLDSYPDTFDKPEPVEVNGDAVDEEVINEQEESIEEDDEHEEDLENTEPEEALEEEERSESDEVEAEEGEGDEEELEEELDSSEEIDYKAQYEQLLKPFKANGSEMQVENVEEAVKLMQMGANYNKKMTALKPNLRKMKMLENNDLFDEDRLNLMIEVAKGNTDAITKIIKDSNIDPLDLNLEGSEYTPKNHTVGDNEVDLDEVVSRIQDTESFADTIDIVSSKWDDTSKRSIMTNPTQLEALNNHVANGVYDYVTKEVNRMRALGSLGNLSDLDAYNQVGMKLAGEGKVTVNGVVQEVPKTKHTIGTKPAKVDKARKDVKKRAASPTRNKGTPQTERDFDPLKMSDEEFEKLFNN